jgi:hypothetical protein
VPEDHLQKSGTNARSPHHSGTPEVPQYALPQDIANSVRHLSDSDLDLLSRACAKETKRRGSKLTRPVAGASDRPIDTPPVPLTMAQVGAVQAAVQGGREARRDCTTIQALTCTGSRRFDCASKMIIAADAEIYLGSQIF